MSTDTASAAPDPLERYYTSEEVADRYRTTVGTVRWWHHVGRGPKPVKLGRKLLYTHTALVEFDAQLRAEADGEPAA